MYETLIADKIPDLFNWNHHEVYTICHMPWSISYSIFTNQKKCLFLSSTDDTTCDDHNCHLKSYRALNISIQCIPLFFIRTKRTLYWTVYDMKMLNIKSTLSDDKHREGKNPISQHFWNVFIQFSIGGSFSVDSSSKWKLTAIQPSSKTFLVFFRSYIHSFIHRYSCWLLLLNANEKTKCFSFILE